MADGEISMGQLAEIVREAMANLIDSGDVDVVLSDDDQEIDVFGDEWTVHLEGWPTRPSAFAAIDDEPDDSAAIPAIRAAVIDGPIHAALVDLDRRMDGALKAALAASADPLSVDLGMALERTP